MGNDIGQLCFICPGGNVDARFEATKNKRCLNIVTNPNIISHRKGCTDFLLQAEIADGSINEHGYDAYCPYDCQQRNQKLKWICACNWLGAKVSVIIGFTTLSIELTPVEISGVQSIMISGLMVSALGIKLNALSKLNGQINRKATIPHSKTWIHLGAFFKTTRKSTTARISQDAAILIFTIFKKSELIDYSFPAAASIMRRISAASC